MGEVLTPDKLPAFATGPGFTPGPVANQAELSPVLFSQWVWAAMYSGVRSASMPLPLQRWVKPAS